MKRITLIDFRGGYASSLSPELMAPNELLLAENCYWDSGLRKRQGTESWDKIWGTATSIVGGMRAYMAQGFTGSGYYNILAMDNGASVTFYHSQSSVTATVFGAYNFTTGYNVEFANMDGAIVAVNGVNKPAIMYCTSTWEAMNLEAFDVRERGTATWWSGQWYSTASVTASIWTSDTDDGQSSATSDFQLYNGSSSNGFWLACNYTFNKIYLYNCEQVSGTYGAAYEYWSASSTWSACSLISSANFSAATATRTIEFNWASDWGLGDSYFEGLDDLANHYVFRCRLSTGPSASFFCGSIALAHTQYLTAVLDNDRPQAVAVHNRRVHLAAGNNVYLSQYASPGGYELKYAEYFLEGGKEILQMVPYQDYLAVLKESALYGFYGNSLDTWIRKRMYLGSGAISKRSASQAKNYLYWVAHDGIYQWDGVSCNKVSRHIQDDFDSWDATNAAGIYYAGEYWVSFPSSSVTLRCDPDSFRTDEADEGRVSWYKMDKGFRQFIYNHEATDDVKFLGIVVSTATALGGNHLCQLEVGHTGQDLWFGSTTAIEMVMQTGYRVLDQFGMHHRYTRLLPKVSQSSNQIDRGDCESATPPMVRGETVPVTSDATWAREIAAWAHEGAASYKFTKTVAAGTLARVDLNDTILATDMHGFLPGQTVTMKCWIYISSVSGILGSEVLIRISDYQGAFETTATYAQNIYDAWQQVTVSKTLRAACTGILLRIQADATAAINEYFNVDDIEIYITDEVTHLLVSDNSSVTASFTHTLEFGSGYDQPYFSIPYTLDGKNLSYYFGHSGGQTIHISGIALEAEGRYF